MAGDWFCVVISIVVTLSSLGAETINICNGMLSDVSSLTMETVGFSEWSSDGQCQCELSFSDNGNGLDLNLEVETFQTDDKQDKDSCSPLLAYHLHEHLFFHCPGNKSLTSRLMLHKKISEPPLRLSLYNPDGKNVKTKISLRSNDGAMFNVACRPYDFSLDLNSCPCVDSSSSAVALVPGHQSTPASKRVLVGFMCALAFLLCIGIFLLVLFLVKRGHIKPVGPLKYLINDKKLKDPYDSSKEKAAATASNLGFVGDSQDSINKLPKTPVSNSIHNLYATVDLSTDLTELPFTPDPNLKLNLKSPYGSEAGTKYRGSLDSGLYSEISSERTDKHSKGTNNSFPVIGATSMETLQALGPGFKFEPPAGQSSPKPPPRVDRDVEAIYAKPDKSKKAKYRNSANLETNTVTPATRVRSSSENHAEPSHPQPLSFRSGSTSSLYSGQGTNLSGSKPGSVNMLPDATYAVPDKSKKKKKRKKPKAMGQLASGSEHSLDGTGSKMSIESLPEYHPKPIQRRSDSTNSVNDRLNLSGPVSMVPNVVYEGLNTVGRHSATSSELHMTDAGNDSHGSRISMETDV